MRQLPRACVDSSVQAIIDRTIVEIEQQGSLPLGPCQADNGKTLLSAGALATRVGVSMLCSQEEAQAFEQEIVSNRDSGQILQRAVSLGLPVELIDMMLRVNDCLAESARLDGVLAYLRGLRTAPRWSS